MMTEPRRFVLQAIDSELGYPAFEAMFVVEEPEELRTLLGDAAASDPELEYFCTLEPAELAAITRHFNVDFDPQGREACLYQWTRRREVPYLVHTGYELVLMLDGRKQFTRMGAEHYPPNQHWDEKRFDRYVAAGVLYKEVELEKFDKPYRSRNGNVYDGLRTVYYTRKGEEWRIPAWKLVAKASKSGWNEHFERLEGMLFGYEDWQNDWWIADMRERQIKHGTLLLYAAIEHAGHRALPPRDVPLEVVVDREHDRANEGVDGLMKRPGAVALARVRVKARGLFELVGWRQGPAYQLPPAQIKDLNRLIDGEIEIVSR